MSLFRWNFIRWFSTPRSSPEIKRQNFVNVQVDAIGVGLANAAAPFLPVFLTRLNATNIEVGLLTTMPAVTGLMLAIPLGRFLQRKTNIVPWFSTARLTVLMSYALTGLVVFFVPKQHLITTILLIWALATLPQTLLSITFSVVMNAVAGPAGRFELMSRRWSILGVTTAVMTFIIGLVLDRMGFPISFQVVFIAMSLGGLFSYYFSSHIDLPKLEPLEEQPSHSIRESVSGLVDLVRSERPFTSFVSKRFVYTMGTTMAAPLFPLFFVNHLNASNSWIAAINTAQTAILIIGYFIWTTQSRRRGSRPVLLLSTLGLAIYPIITALTHQVWPIVIYASFAGIFQAGLNLVFFDELMKTCPVSLSATFIAVSQSADYLATIFAPLLGSFLADQIGLPGALIFAGLIRLLGFGLFAGASPLKLLSRRPPKTEAEAESVSV